MGFDKSLIEFNGIPQRVFLFNLLKNFCENVFLSLNENQVLNDVNIYPVVKDDPQLGDIGPMKALLSFWKNYPESNVLAVGCDYPFIDADCIQKILENRKGVATCFLNKKENIYEPVLTIYESSFRNILSENFNNKNYSLSKILKHENATAILPPSELALLSVNTPQEFYSAKKMISIKTI